MDDPRADDLRALLGRVGLDRHADALILLSRPSLRLRHDLDHEEGALHPRPTGHRSCSRCRRLSPFLVEGTEGSISVDARNRHVLVLRSDGSVGANTAAHEAASQVLVLGAGATAVAAGDGHGLALLEDGAVVAWGRNSSGQLGDGTTTDREVPAPVVGLGQHKVRAIAAGSDHSLALLDDGSVAAWGSNFKGQLGDATTTSRCVPTPVVGFKGPVVAVAAGDRHCLTLLHDGTVMAWGDNRTGGLGDDTTIDRHRPVPVVGLGGPVGSVAAGADHSLALLIDGSVLSWGGNYRGQLGDGTNTMSETTRALTAVAGRVRPGPVEQLNEPVTAIAAGFLRSFAVTDDGRVVGWGANWDGQLGDGTTTDRHSPIRVGGPPPIRLIAAGYETTLALTNDGRVMTWGGPYARSDYDADIAVGATKLGGRPDLPTESAWPASTATPHSFLGQIDLADTGVVCDKPLALPPAGLLSFFYDPERQPDGYSPGDHGGWHVIFTEPGAELRRTPFPANLSPEARYPGVRLRLVFELRLPSITSKEIEGVAFDSGEASAYQELLSDDSSSEPVHRLLGYEEPVQTGHLQQLVCQLGANRMEYLDRSLDAAMRQQSWDKAAAWHLLLQVDSDPEVGFEWGDAGRIYYWARDEDLLAGRLCDTWLVGQSH